NRLVHGLSEWSRQFSGWGKPALLGHDHPGKHRLEASSAQEPPGSKLKAEIPVGSSRLGCARSQLTSRYPWIAAHPPHFLKDRRDEAEAAAIARRRRRERRRAKALEQSRSP